MKYGENSNSEKALIYLENSFLKELLEDEDITDISFNGDTIYYVHNFLGRRKSDIYFTSEMAKDFLRQLANLSEKQFSYQSPLLNISVANYRINGVFNSIGRLQNKKVYTFTIRKASLVPRIHMNSPFLTKELISLFRTLLNNKISIIISGVTGSGKTELQKFLISLLKENTRVIIIDEVLELDNLNDTNYLDMNIWQTDVNTNAQQLVRNALRSNPDWLIVSESRGEEMLDVLNSSMTGHPIITTIHSVDVSSIPDRVSAMVMMNEKKMEKNNIINDFVHHIPIGIYLKKIETDRGEVKRIISDIAEFKSDGDINKIYEFKNNEHKYFKISQRLKSLIDVSLCEPLFVNTFIKEGT